jgi:hypothetical protein
MVALVKAKGYRIQTIESTDESVTVVGVSPTGDQEQATWTLERARKAGYLSNKKYEQEPQAMLYAKAAAEVCRRLAPEVLLGIAYTVEDLDNAPIKTTSERVYSRPSARDVLDAEPAPKTISREARKKLTDAMLAAGVGKKLDEARAWMSDVLGRDVISTEQLTKADEAALYAELAAAPEPADEVDAEQLTIGDDAK